MPGSMSACARTLHRSSRNPGTPGSRRDSLLRLMRQATKGESNVPENYEPISHEEFDSINIATAEGMRRLAEMAGDGPIFRVLHACDRKEVSDGEV